MKRNSRNILAFLLSSLILTIASCGKDKSEISADTVERETAMTRTLQQMLDKPLQPVSKGVQPHANNIGRFQEVFNDSNKFQYAYAEKFGIRPIESLRDAYYTTRPIVKTEDNKFYTVAPLTHSMPYLVPEAELLLRVIGRNFIDSLHSRGVDNYRIIATSMLRTAQTVKKLRRVNVNATDSSCHKFATTFDISHSRFACSDSSRQIDTGTLKGILAEVLLDLRRQNLCMVKYERKTACFHITVTPR